LVRFQNGEPTQSLNCAIKNQAEDALWSELISRRSYLSEKSSVPRKALDAARLSDIWSQIRDFIGDDSVVDFHASGVMSDLFISLEGASVGADIEYFDISVISSYGLGLWPWSSSNPISFLEEPYVSKSSERAESAGQYTVRMLRLTETSSIKQLASRIYGCHMTKLLTNHGPLHLHPREIGAEEIDLWKTRHGLTPPTIEYHQTFGNVSDAGWSREDISSGKLFSDVTRHLSFEGKNIGVCGVGAGSDSIFRFLREVTAVEGAPICQACMNLAT